MAVTQQDIAREAGVSQTIVSDVLHGRVRGRVREDTRQRIFDIARQMGYRPNAMAQALRSRQSRQIVYLTTTEEADEFSPLSDSDIGGIVRRLRDRGYRLLIQTAASSSEETEAIAEMMASGICDGAVVRAYNGRESLWHPLKALSQPVVAIGQCPDPDLTSIAHDVPYFMRSIIEYLAERGHSRVGILLPVGHDRYGEMIPEYWNPLAAEHGFDPTRWARSVDGRAPAEAVAREWLAADPAPSAMISLDRGSALGATRAAASLGLRVGSEIDIVAVADVRARWAFDPGTIHCSLDLQKIGETAAELLLSMLDGEPSAGPVRIKPAIVTV